MDGNTLVSRQHSGGSGNAYYASPPPHISKKVIVDGDYPNYLRYRRPPVKQGAWKIATGHCLGAIGVVLLAIVAVIALIGVIEISKHRKAWEMMGETVVGLHNVLVDGGGILSDFREAWKDNNGTELLKRLLARDEYEDDGSLIPYDEEYERDKANHNHKADKHHRKSKEDLANGIHNVLGLVGDIRRSKFFYEWSLIGYHCNQILEKPETERAVKSLLSRSSDVMDQLDPVDLANIVAGMDLGPELKQALLAFTKIVSHIFGTPPTTTTTENIDRQTKQGEVTSVVLPQKTVIDRGMDALEKIAKIVNAPEAKLILAQFSKLQLQPLINQGQKTLNATTMAVEDFNRKHIMKRMDNIMIRSEEILGGIEEVVNGFESQGVNIVLRPPLKTTTTNSNRQLLQKN